MEAWAGQFGREYTDRNAHTVEEMELLYRRQYGITRTEMNSRFLGNLDRGIRILEVGSNIGNQLLALRKAGFNHLYGIELQSYAVQLSKRRTTGIHFVQGCAFDLPFRDGLFDLVFTAGLLIHIAPQDITRVLDELYRCAKRYIWCFEYYADTYTQVDYRGHADLLWKTDFSKLFLGRFSNLKSVREEHFTYSNSDNVDVMFLVEKR